jgi:RNA polymerase sigma factor (sigma-70 family)
MEDREIVAAIVAGDLAALADAYDQYAESLYGYCRWVLNDPDDAADAVQDTFVIAAGKLGGLRDSRKLRPWLYAVARNECHRRRHAPRLGLDAAAGLAGPAADAPDNADNADRDELRRLVRAALAGLSPAEQEVLELSLRHDLQGADLAAVLGGSRTQAHALVSSARGQLEKALGARLVARTGRRDCARLDLLLAGSGGRLTGQARKEISRHIDQCQTCDDRRRGVLRPAALFGMTPLVALPRWLRREVLGLCADDSDVTLAYRHEVMLRVGPLHPNGFPQAIRERRRQMVALARIAAVAGIVIALASAGIISALALGGAHPPHALSGARTSAGPATASAAETTGATASDVAPPPASPATSPPAAVEQAPASVPSGPASAQPSPSRSASSPASPRPKPTPSVSLNSPTPTPTPTATPTPTPSPSSTGTPLPTPTPTPSFSF